jgi:hypothetical protein
MLRAITGGEKKTLVEEAKARMKRARKKHQQLLVEFANLLSQEIPIVVLRAAELNLTRYDWDMSKSETFEAQKLKSKYFLLSETTLKMDEWQYVHEALVSRLKAEPDISWKPFIDTAPFQLTLIWETV